MPIAGASAAPGPITRETLHRGAKFDFERLTYTGRDGKPLSREVVRHPGAVVIVPALPDGRLVLIRNYRIAIERWTWEFPAGTLGKGEDPGACAGRELIEETGYRAGRITALLSFLTTPGLTDERMHAFFADALTHVGQALEEDESIEVRPTPAPEVFAMLDRGELADGKSIVALLTAARRGLIHAPPRGGGS